VLPERPHWVARALALTTPSSSRTATGLPSRLAWFSEPSPRTRQAAAAATLVSLLLAWWLVDLTGGVKYSAVHAMYLPVIGAALIFEVRGALLIGVAAGLLVGPFMALDIDTGEAQDAANWLQRMFFFCLIGALVGLGSGLFRRQMRYLAWLNDHDSRTGFLTHGGLTRNVQQRLSSVTDGSTPVVLVVQLNNLLDIQNTFGPQFGEQLLTRICERGRELVPHELPMALIQPDRLGVMMSSTSQVDDLRDRLDRRIREPYDVEGVRVYVDFAFGAAVYPTHATTAEELVQKASIAMHLAMKRTLPWYVYDSRFDATSRDNLVLLGLVPAAIAGNELTMWHQAKTSLATGQVAGTEALLRWNHPERGLIMPGRFMPQVEDSPMINDVTRWVVGCALDHLAMWRQRGHSFSVSLNVSVRNLHNRVLLHVLDDAVVRHGVAPEDVDLEITESAVMDDFEHCVGLIAQLRDRGYSVSIDDFGTGHSSLAYLKKLPVTKLKIDQAFIRNLAADDRDQRITRSIIDLAAALRLESVAEGVEDEASAHMLREWGCDYAQGHYLHVACPYDEFISWIERTTNLQGST
jgi:EAL domain-containing protein (putative c-di-GMP-specific phosphodiesterase class I)/GGDEF domain-containing protein